MDKQINYFENNYEIIARSILFLMGKKYILGQKKTKYVVTADKTAVTLSSKKIAHALPEFIGNKRVIANDECDICNDHLCFGEMTSVLRCIR